MANDYPALFRTYLGRRLRQMQRIVEREDFVHTPREQERAMLQLGLVHWPTVEPVVTCALLTFMAPKMEMAGHRDEWRSYLQRPVLSRHIDAGMVQAELA
ncbi:MAG: hypothetical protein R2911_23300 [Caldilineaceae bacterium]